MSSAWLFVHVLSTGASACGNWFLSCPTANIKGVCNFNDATYSMQRMEDDGDDDYCLADPNGACQVPSDGALIPLADSTERVEDGHSIKISSSSNSHLFCIWQEEEKVFGAPNCQYAKKRQLAAEIPGSWNVVVSPTGEISLWEPQESKQCPDAPKPVCAVNKSNGKWSYRHTITAPTTETWRHGTERTHEESKVRTWTSSVSTSVSVGFVHWCPGLAMGGGVGVTVTGETAYEVSQKFSDEWSTHEEEEFQIHWTEEHVGRASWQFIFTHVDTCKREETTATQEFALTLNGRDEPCCLPGFAADAPFYKICLSEEAMIPNWRDHGCSLSSRPDGWAAFLSGAAHYHPVHLFLLFGLFAHLCM